MLRGLWLVTLIFGLSTQSGAVNLPDSIGLEKKNDKWFVAHKIEQGETFYSLGVRYSVDVEKIMQANQNTKVLSVGQVLLVPYSDLPYFEHKVLAGETLYAIASKYNVTSDDLKDWNGLSEDSINPGDRLRINEIRGEASQPMGEWAVHIVLAGEGLFSIARQHDVQVDSIKVWNYLISDEIQEGMYLKYRNPAPQDRAIASIEPSEPQSEISYDSFTSNSLGIDSSLKAIPLPLYEERGMASLIEGTEGSEKFLALHKSAPSGTILVVRNELNNQVVFVRVIGQLPNTGANEKIIVKVSEAAWNNVHAVNNKFRVKVSYFK